MYSCTGIGIYPYIAAVLPQIVDAGLYGGCMVYSLLEY
jgi:hypothetical protein